MSSDQQFNLDVIEIATPCNVSWDEMRGDDCVRHCEHCQLNVFNLSSLPRDEAEKLVLETEDRVCVRLFRRADGTVLTKDCPVGIGMLRRRLGRSLAAVATLVGLLTCGIVFGRQASATTGQRTVAGPLSRLIQWIEPPPDVSVMGVVCPLPAPAPFPPPAAPDNSE